MQSKNYYEQTVYLPFLVSAIQHSTSTITESRILSGTIANYSPDDHPDLKIGAPNIVMGAAETLFPTIEADGSFKINIPLYHNTQVRMTIGKADIVILLSPDKETNVAVNLSNPHNLYSADNMLPSIMNGASQN